MNHGKLRTLSLPVLENYQMGDEWLPPGAFEELMVDSKTLSQTVLLNQ